MRTLPTSAPRPRTGRRQVFPRRTLATWSSTATTHCDPATRRELASAFRLGQERCREGVVISWRDEEPAQPRQASL